MENHRKPSIVGVHSAPHATGRSEPSNQGGENELKASGVEPRHHLNTSADVMQGIVGVSINGGTPKSAILNHFNKIFSLIDHPAIRVPP